MNKIHKFITSIKESHKKSKLQATHRITSIEQNEEEEYTVVAQLINKNAFFCERKLEHHAKFRDFSFVSNFTDENLQR